MAPLVGSSRRERVRSVWRARKTLADAFAEDGYAPAQVLQRRLKRAVREAKQQVLEDAPKWYPVPRAGTQLRIPQNYFADFAEQVVRTINRLSEHEAHERVAAYQRRLDESSRTFLRESDVYNERLALDAKPNRMVDRKCMEEELYLYDPLQYWDKDQQVVMREIITERLRRILPNLAALLEAGAMNFQEKEDAAKLAEFESESDPEDMDDEARTQAKEARKIRNEDLKVRQQHDEDVAQAKQDTKNLTRTNEDLRRQIEVMRKMIEAAEAERDKLANAKQALHGELDMKAQVRAKEIERLQKLAEEQQRKSQEGASAGAAKEAAAVAERAEKVVAEADKVGETILTYTWAEQLKNPLADELEAERNRWGLSREEWNERLVILNKHAKEVRPNGAIPGAAGKGSIGGSSGGFSGAGGSAGAADILSEAVGKDSGQNSGGGKSNDGKNAVKKSASANAGKGSTVEDPSLFEFSESTFSMTIVLRAASAKPIVVAKVVHKKADAPEPKQPNRDEMNRLVREALRGVEAEQAKERAQLQAKIEHLELAIADLQCVSSDEEEEVTVLEGAPRKKKQRQPEEEPGAGPIKKGGGENWKAPPSLKYGGEVKVKKTIATVYKSRGIFERLHGEASEKKTRMVMQTQDEASAASGAFRLADTEEKPAVVDKAFSAAGGQLAGTRAKRVNNLRSEEVSPSISKPMHRRPSSAATLGSIAAKAQRGSSATNKRKPGVAAGWLTGGWQPGIVAQLDDLVPSGTMTLEGVMQQRAPGEAGRVSAGLQRAPIGQLEAAGVPGCRVPDWQPWDGITTRKELDRLPATGPGVSQWGSSVLQNRTAAEPAGPARVPLLRAAFDQHLRETGAEDYP